MASSQTKYRYFVEGRHGWLEVPRVEVEASGATISPYSYYNPKTGMVYLEEDVDMINFMKATDVTLSDMKIQTESFSPRTLPRYEKAK